jgi:molybdopterin converting factor small subunit
VGRRRGDGEVVEELPEGSKLLDLIRRLEAKFDGAFFEVLDRESGSVDEEVMVLINGVAVRKVDEELRDGDSVLPIPIMGGAERA